MIENPESAAASASSSAAPQKKKRGFLARLRLLLLFVVLLLLVAAHAPVFPLIVRAVLKFRAWQSGATISMGAVEGNYLEPVVIHDLLWTYRAETGAVTRVEIRRMRAWLAWSNIFPAPVAGWVRSGAERLGLYPIGGNGLWFRELEMDDVSAKLSLPNGADAAAGDETRSQWLRRALAWRGAQPGIYTVRNADLILDRGDDWLRVSGAYFSLSETAAGFVRAAQIAMKTDSGRKRFGSVRGRTSLDGSRATITGMVIAPDVTLQSLSVSLEKFAMGQLGFSMALTAFGGDFNAEAEAAFEGRRLRFDGNGNLSKISVAGLASFLGLGDAAGGVVNSGHFTFHGTPSDFAKSEATLRLEVGAFQWESRQWDSLVLGLSLVDQRLQIPELRLRQGQNQLMLKGTMALPQPGVQWWDRQFDFKVDADIRNLTDLSALMLPEFKYAAGQLFIRGAVSGSGAQPDASAKYEGEMIVSGNELQWRTAPIDSLNAALLFHERELQIISAQLVHADDILRGSGRISLGDGSYSGEWRLSARDLGVYRTALTPYILPTPLGGGIEATWSGKGGGAKHEGSFSAKLNRFRLLGPGGTLPLDAEAAGVYRPGEVQCEEFRLEEDGTVLTAGISVGPSAVNLRGLRVLHHGRVCLHGDAFLPLDLWQRWPDVSFAHLLNDDTVSRVHLEANELDLRAVSRLTGVDWPLGGTVTGTVTADGPLAALKLGGNMQLMHGVFPLDWKGDAVREVSAQITLEGNAIRIEQGMGRYVNGDFGIGGRLDLAKPRAPRMEAVGSGTYQSQPFTFSVKGDAMKPVITVEGHAPFSGNAPVPSEVRIPAPAATPAPTSSAPPTVPAPPAAPAPAK
ncbi:MAG: hypothetical protein ABI318_24475 [Chthoniobacteraceae bacterium]